MVSETTKLDKTCIQVSVETRERLIKLGSKNESYEDILQRVLDQLEELTKNK
jgi:hypothetical protein